MIVLLLSCSITWSQNNVQDSVLVPISAIKIANVKMIELKYEKDINTNLREIISNDSIIIDNLRNNLDACEFNSEQEIKRIKKQRNQAIIIGGGITIVSWILFLIVNGN